MNHNPWQSPIFLSDISTYQDWLTESNKQNFPNRPSLTHLSEYKIFEDANPGSETKPVPGCGTCAAKGNLPLRSAIKSLEQQEKGRSQTPQDNARYVNVAGLAGQELSQTFAPPSQDQQKFFEEAKKYFTDWFSKPDTAKKFKNPGSKQKLINWINQKLQMRVWFQEKIPELWGPSKSKNVYGWVFGDRPHYINLNKEALTRDQHETKETIYHEIGHSIDFFLESIGDSPIKGQQVANFFIPGKRQEDKNETSGETKDYIADPMENSTRLRNVRRLWGLSPNATCSEIKQKVESLLRLQKLEFYGTESYQFIEHRNPQNKQAPTIWWLKLRPVKKITQEPTFTELVRDIFGGENSFEGARGLDISRFLAHVAQFRDGFIWINLCKIAQMNQDLVMKDKDESNDTREA